MRRVSPKRAKLNRKANKWRLAKRKKHGCCMNCGHSPTNPRLWMPMDCSEICVHEISNGGLRGKSLMADYATLVLCWHCNQYEFSDKSLWPVERQLAMLLVRAPEEYDLEAFVFLVKGDRAPNWITQPEVDVYVPTIPELRAA